MRKKNGCPGLSGQPMINMLAFDAVGLAGIFTAVSISHHDLQNEYRDNLFLPSVFVGTITGVSGGILHCPGGRNPYIFVKHVYACASIAGALFLICYRKVSDRLPYVRHFRPGDPGDSWPPIINESARPKGV